jgi:hypothetical protein
MLMLDFKHMNSRILTTRMFPNVQTFNVNVQRSRNLDCRGGLKEQDWSNLRLPDLWGVGFGPNG